jgi:glycosyltransferase involved in cell wall biosynthesis
MGWIIADFAAPTCQTDFSMARRRHILQIFNRYLQYGGEEGSVYRIGDALQSIHDVEYFISSTAEMISEGSLGSWAVPWKAAYNSEIDTKLKQYQQAGHFDAWQIHNIFPVMSPVVYHRAMEWNVPIVHYLHNYRLSCVNGFFLNHGKPCQRCLSGNFWPAFTTACWRDSHMESGWMGLITGYIRTLPLFEKVFQWVALSEAQKYEHVRMGIPAEKIEVIPHFLEAKDPPLPPASSPTALFVGRLSLEKGVAQLLNSWKLIAGGERKLIIIGDGPERAHLERQAKNIPGVQFLGFIGIEEQLEHWRKALFSIVPSIWIEPFGMTVLESWAKGRAVVAHRIGALPELIEDGVSGLLASPESEGELADRMERLLSSPEEAEKMGLAGRQRLETHFSRQKWVDRIAKIYSKLP